MLKMSPFLTFLLYCLFISFTIYYLTKDKLDETSRYMLIGVLILPYIFMDQSESFSTMIKENIENYSPIESNQPNVNHSESILNKLEQPKINLNQNEKVINLKIIEEENNRKKIQEENKIKKLADEIKKKTFTFDEVKSLLNSINKNNKTLEKYGSMYTGNVLNEYNENDTFTSQLLKPLGENGNGLTNKWDHDYILLNTDKWGPALNPPPVCKTEKTCPVCPNLTTGYPLMVRDFDNTRRITPPIEADIKQMNNTTSSEPTNEQHSTDHSSSQHSMNNSSSQHSMNNSSSEQSMNSNNKLVGKSPFNISSLISSVSKEDRPKLITELAKQFQISETDLITFANLE